MKAGAGSIYLPKQIIRFFFLLRVLPTKQIEQRRGAQIRKDFKVNWLPPVTTRYI
jgi:hypothetical protein